jgi:hypothetical protein
MRHLPRICSAAGVLPVMQNTHSGTVHGWQRQLQHQWEALKEWMHKPGARN